MILSTVGGDPFEVTVGDCVELDFVPVIGNSLGSRSLPGSHGYMLHPGLGVSL
mgnify:CR=1 FL=1